MSVLAELSKDTPAYERCINERSIELAIMSMMNGDENQDRSAHTIIYKAGEIRRFIENHRG